MELSKRGMYYKMIYTLKLSDNFTFDGNVKDKIYLDKEQFKEQLDERIKNKKLLIEFSNPVSIDLNVDFIIKRATIVKLDQTCLFVESLKFINDTCYFNVKSLSGFKGPEFDLLIDSFGEENIQLVPYGLKNEDLLLITSFYIKVV